MPSVELLPCTATGCVDTAICRHPSDPNCARCKPSPSDPNLASNRERCNAWSYPGHQSWDVKLTKPDGRQCALNMNHEGPHELVGRWSLPSGRASSSVEQVNHPSHYGGESNPYEAIKVIAAWRLGFCLGNTVKYISRAGKKDPSKLVEDLEKARWYLDEAIKRAKLGEKPF